MCLTGICLEIIRQKNEIFNIEKIIFVHRKGWAIFVTRPVLAQVWHFQPIKALIFSSTLIYTYYNYYRLLIVNSITDDIVNYSDLENNERNITINTHALRKSHAEKCLRKDLIDR